MNKEKQLQVNKRERKQYEKPTFLISFLSFHLVGLIDIGIYIYMVGFLIAMTK